MYYEMMTTLFDKPNATVEGLLYLHIVFDTIILYPYCPFYEKYSKIFHSLSEDSNKKTLNILKEILKKDD